MDERGWEAKQQEQERRNNEMENDGDSDAQNWERKEEEQRRGGRYEAESDDGVLFEYAGDDEDTEYEFCVESGGNDDDGNHNVGYVDEYGGQMAEAMESVNEEEDNGNGTGDIEVGYGGNDDEPERRAEEGDGGGMNVGENENKENDIIQLNLTGVSAEDRKECEDRLEAEFNEFDIQMNKIIGVGWESRSDSIAETPKKLRICLKNKVCMHFYAGWFPENGTARSGYEEAMKAYMTGWGVVMHELIKINIDTQ